MPNVSAACGVLLFALSLAAQTDTPKPASIEGVVKDSLSGAPIPRVKITLGHYATTASAEGKFKIDGIAPGNYRFTARRPGFVISHKKAEIVLRAGEAKTDAEIALIPTGGIAGRVIEADGEPVESARVQVEDGSGVVCSISTDEYGKFRAGGLAPGRYRVLAAPSEIWRGRPEIRTDGTVEHHDAATYYPGAIAPEAAGSVSVRAGVDSTGIDILLVRVPFVRVSGRAVGLPRGAQNAVVTARRGANGDSTSPDQDGAFELWRLDPGKYRLDAEWTAANGELFETAGVEIEVGDSNIENVELRFIPPGNISGQLEYEDEGVKELVRRDLPGPLVQIFATGSVAENVEDASPVAAEGTFRLERVPPGRYWLGLADEKFYVKSMRLGAMPVDGAILDLRGGANGADLTLVVSRATGVVTGAVQDEVGNAAGAAVVLVEASDETSFGPRHAIAGADGAYTFSNVPPGSYKVVASGEENLTIADNHVLGYENQMDTVTVGDGEKIIRDLRRRTAE